VLLERETGTLYRRAPTEVVLCYPNSYRVAGSSLGFQVIYRALNRRDDVACHRAVLPDVALHGMMPPPVHSLEYGKPIGDYDAVLVSIAYELDLAHLAMMLQASGLSPLAAERPHSAPPVIVGGPLTSSNVLPLGWMADVVVMGEADEVIATLLDWLAERPDRAALQRQAAAHPGLWVPAVHGDAVPDQLSVRGDALPALGQWHSPDAELSDMMLLEASRGCPRYCTFCVVRAPMAPMREPELDRVIAALDRPEYQAAHRIGLVGAAVSDWAPIKGALRAAIARGKQIGISSLRADRLDEDDEFVDLLFQGGYRTLTVASDAPSQRLRGKLAKGIRERHLWGAAQQARRVGMKAFKMYVIIGLPGETESDIAELVDFARRLSTQVRTTLTLSPFVPKLHTPLAEAPFEPLDALTRKLRAIQSALGGRVEVRFDSPKAAWLEYRLSQGGMATAGAVIAAARNGGGHAAWRAAFAELDASDGGEERRACEAAVRHGLWALSGAR
jgi:radical SAM superfamily enzyme YgiQ (UPF0313 family)